MSTAKKPEELAREWIDKKLQKSGWQVVDRTNYDPRVNAVAIREALMKGHLEADYLLLINGRAVGVLEAKKESIKIDSPKLMEQAENYARQLQDWYPCWQTPLPLIYVSNGHQIAFRDYRKSDSKYQLLKDFPRPIDIVQKLSLPGYFSGLPVLDPKGLRACQYEAISNLENSFRNDQKQKRALIVLATGAGKTFTACTIAYRFLSFTPAKRILYLVDRNNLGVGTQREFTSYKMTETGQSFSDIFGVKRLRGGKIDENTRVMISTIQGLYAKLSGYSEEISEELEDRSCHVDSEKEVVLPENPELPPDYFDLIFVDECHRSIYSKWRKVLEYFQNAYLIGMTATPIPQTLSFFNKNQVSNYDLNRSIQDGVNVRPIIYRIKTVLSEEGGVIEQGSKVEETSCKTNETTEIRASEDQEFSKSELNRSVVVPDQIRKVLQEYKDIVYTKLYPDRKPQLEYLPKTLIFTISEAHAKRVVDLVKEVFQPQDPRFVQRITYSCDNPNNLIKSFRNDVAFRIAVTVTLVATGTDVRPLEVLMFLNDVRSEPLYIQMKGRGVRTISPDQLHDVTPNAREKNCCYIIDAVGVTESEKIVPIPGGDDNPINPSLRELLERLSLGYVPDHYLQLLGDKLARVSSVGDKKHLAIFNELARFELSEFAERIIKTVMAGTLPEFSSSNDKNFERRNLIAPLINNLPAREKLLEIVAGYVKTLPDLTDTIISSHFSEEQAKVSVSAFENYVNEHKDEIEALRLIYNNKTASITRTMLLDLQTKLQGSLQGFNLGRLWNDYALLSEDKKKVRPLVAGQDLDALTNLIQLVSFAYKNVDKLFSVPSVVASRFELWCGRKQRELEMTSEQKELFKKIASYVAVNGGFDFRTLYAIDNNLATNLLRATKDIEAANRSLQTLGEYILKVA